MIVVMIVMGETRRKNAMMEEVRATVGIVIMSGVPVDMTQRKETRNVTGGKMTCRHSFHATNGEKMTRVAL